MHFCGLFIVGVKVLFTTEIEEAFFNWNILWCDLIILLKYL